MITGRPSLPDIARKWAKASDRGKGIRLSAEEVDILNAAGVGLLLATSAGTQQREEAIRRRAPADGD